MVAGRSVDVPGSGTGSGMASGTGSGFGIGDAIVLAQSTSKAANGVISFMMSRWESCHNGQLDNYMGLLRIGRTGRAWIGEEDMGESTGRETASKKTPLLAKAILHLYAMALYLAEENVLRDYDFCVVHCGRLPSLSSNRVIRPTKQGT
ncbi:hypothetical protein FRC14_007982 [Serendipita sp. 396]|nr:hypothetical protein FRC14_007982 [Serendipita sp. 396]